MTTASRPIPLNPGSALMRAYRAVFWNRIRLMQRTASVHPDIVRSTFGPRELISINRPEYVHEVLVEQEDKFTKGREFAKYTRPVLGHGLLLSEGDFHQRQRKLVAPQFVHRRIREYTKVMTECTEQMMASWHDGMELDISREMSRVTLSITGKTLFGSDVGDEADDVKSRLTFLMRYVEQQLRLPFHAPYAWPTPKNLRVRKAVAGLDEIIFRMIDERRNSNTDSGDLLSMLLSARDENGGSGMTDQQIRDEAMTIFLAGHETTANAMTWMWYLLAKHPEVFQKLTDEVAILKGRAPTMDDLPTLPYAMQVFKEAMRLYPPAYIIVRTVKEDVLIDGYKLNAGAALIISPYLLHRNHDYFPNPEAFDPDRFTPERERAIPRHGYLPFGAGPRICIGNQFALTEGHLMTAAIAQRFRFELLDQKPIEMEPLITLRPKGGIRVRVRSV